MNKENFRKYVAKMYFFRKDKKLVEKMKKKY